MAEGEVIPDKNETDKNKKGETVRTDTNTTPRLVTKEMAAAAGFNVKSPILNAVVQNLKELSSEEAKRKNPTEKHCPVCNISCNNSDGDMLYHILGRKHKNRMWSLRIIQNLNRVYKVKALKDPTKREYVCPSCKVTANSPIQLVSHMRSKRHTSLNTKSGIVLSANPVDDLSRPSVTYFCQYCEIHLNSYKKMIQHTASFKHKIHIEMAREALRSYW